MRGQVERRSERVLEGGEGDEAAAFADDQLGRGDIDRARRQSVAMPSTRPAASWQSANAIEPNMRTRWATSLIAAAAIGEAIG